MRKAGIAALALAALLALSACGDGDVNQNQPAGSDGGGGTAKGESVPGAANGGSVPGAANGGSVPGGEDGGETGTDGPSGVTMGAIPDANRTEVLLARRGSFLMEAAYAPEIDATGEIAAAYADGENVFLQTDSTHELYTFDGCYLFMDGYFGPPLSPEPEDPSSFTALLLDEGTTSLEEITGVEQNEGILTVRTVLSADAIAGYFGEALESTAYAAGDSTQSVYTLDAEDLAVLSCSTVLYHGDGSAQDVGTMEVSYGVEMPENGVILREHLDAPDRRTVTLVLDPGAPEETQYTVTAQKGDRVFTFLPEGYYVLYTDPACTQEYEFDEENLTEDVTLYVPRMGLSGVLDTAVLADAGDGGQEDYTGYAGYAGTEAYGGHARDAERDQEEYDASHDHDHGGHDEQD